MQIRHPADLQTSHWPRQIRQLGAVAHGIIVKLDATAIRDHVQCIRGCDAAQVGATSRTAAADVEFTGAVAGVGGKEVEGPLEVSREEGECIGGEGEGGESENESRGRHFG